MPRSTVVLGLLGSTLDAGDGPRRWDRWRPTVSIGQHEDLLVKRLELLHEPAHGKTAQLVARDVRHVSPETEVRLSPFAMKDAWDFEEVFGALHDYARGYPFKPDDEDYLVHITTGTHVAQICLFLLTESRHFPARLLQTSPPARGGKLPGRIAIIDLAVSRYDRLARRFAKEAEEATSLLKSGIATRNARFNRLIDQIEHVALQTDEPILLIGPTGAGKSQLAARIFELKRQRHKLTGPFVEVNCATLRGDAAMSALFGHRRGAFTGAIADRPGLLKAADGGVLFLDELGELGLDEQAMLLRALEEKRFLPVGADREVASDFQLLAGTNRDLGEACARGRFRDDLLARINLWTFALPGLADRPEDLEPNLDYVLDQHSRRSGKRVTFNREARARFLAFATSSKALWTGNFRDLNASVTRMATLAPQGRIDEATVADELARLESDWGAREGVSAVGAGRRAASGSLDSEELAELLERHHVGPLDLFDEIQLAAVLDVCRQSKSVSEAGRKLFSVSRAKKTSSNDAHRLRRYLARFGISFAEIERGEG
jgi:transcriptional regulatory protein RtcR